MPSTLCGRWCPVAVGTLLLVAPVLGRGHDDPQTAVLALLAAYDAGKYDIVDRALASQPKGPLAAELLRQGDRWIKTGSAVGLDHRRMIAGAVALEIVGAGLTDEWYSVYGVIEWACKHVVATAPGSEAEQAWHLGSIALLQAGGGGVPTREFAQGHLAHSLKRVAGSPRIRLAVVSDQEHEVFAPRRRIDQSEIPPDVMARFRSQFTSVVEQYTALTSLPNVAEEASLRLGAFYSRVGFEDYAVNALTPLTRSSDGFVGYVSAFLVGEAFRKKGRNGDAATAYRQALTFAPNAMSASLGLSSALAATGDIDGALAAVNGAATSAAPVDPWRIFAFGSGRQWPRWRDSLRQEMRR